MHQETSSNPVPDRIGRYRVRHCLAVGSFGTVYRAHDDELERDVAVKVVHAHLLRSAEAVRNFLAEGRILAALDHPGILPVYDMGRMDDGRCFLVAKFIEGSDLKKRLQQQRLATEAAVQLIVPIAEALHYAHERGLIHRDIKPANILLDRSDQPLLADFGLALRQEEFGTGAVFVGTLLYMSPEQARRESHRVNTRTDIYSLGAVLYEMLAGRLPFVSQSKTEYLEMIQNLEAPPPSQFNGAISSELDRICLKALAKRSQDRYATAAQLAEELRLWRVKPIQPTGTETETALGAPAGLAASGRRLIPRGLRAFTEPDADFFLELLPGPRNRAGLPDSVDFWKRRLESLAQQSRNQTAPSPPASGGAPQATGWGEGGRDSPPQHESMRGTLTPSPPSPSPTALPRSGGEGRKSLQPAKILENSSTDAESTFEVGLIHGPSGCGKTSLLRAGVLPRLAGHVVVVCLEATPDHTESQLLQCLRQRLPELPGDLGLVESMEHARRGDGLSPGRKVVVVLDQIEQWLLADRPRGELIAALRQCDGVRLQALLLVRDDCWLAVSRFFLELEVPLREGHNCALVDLFSPTHARKVLAELGRALGRLPHNLAECAPAQRAFLDQAVIELADAGSIVPVRLALFAETIKNKPWIPDTLHELGGASGIGVAFLDEAFGANPERRGQLRATRAVLEALMPEGNANIKGRSREWTELLAISGYAAQPPAFADLMHLLDQELRLVTPSWISSDAPSKESETAPSDDTAGLNRQLWRHVSNVPDHVALSDETATLNPRPKPRYQLTHDYLVQDLRQWLIYMKGQTRRGWVELRLADRSAEWQARPETRQLPTWWEWLNIHLFSRRRRWTPVQRKMLQAANRFFALRLGLGLLVLLLAGGLAWRAERQVQEERENAHAHELLQWLDDPEDMVHLRRAVERYRRRLEPLLRDVVNDPAATPRVRLHARMMLLAVDPEQVTPLQEELLTAPQEEIPRIIEALRPYRQEIVADLWRAVDRAETPAPARLRALGALAHFDPDNPRWKSLAPTIVDCLLQQPLSALSGWLQILHPVLRPIRADLITVLRKWDHSSSQHVIEELLRLATKD